MIETATNKHLVCAPRICYPALGVSPWRHHNPAHQSGTAMVSSPAGASRELSQLHQGRAEVSLLPCWRVRGVCGSSCAHAPLWVLLLAWWGSCCLCLCPGQAGNHFCQCWCSDGAIYKPPSVISLWVTDEIKTRKPKHRVRAGLEC